MIYFFVFVILLILELAYLNLAERFNIIDKPNQRSLHSKVTIRGGGIIFVIGALFYFFYSDFQFKYFFAGLIFISAISFLDDLFTIPNRYRIIVQFLAVFLLVKELSGFSQVGFWAPLVMVVLVGILNAYNFMDGINGITGGYSLVNMISLLYVNCYHTKFVDNEFVIFVSFSLVVFNFFNFRKRAKCFAGDIGSISMAFIIIFLLLKLIFQTNDYVYILFLTLYGVDTIFTLIVRILNRENIFVAHNKHFFQLLVNKLHFSHLQVTWIYMFIQMLINLSIILALNYDLNLLVISVSIITISSCSYLLLRKQMVELYTDH